jgi:hypothetical protein
MFMNLGLIDFFSSAAIGVAAVLIVLFTSGVAIPSRTSARSRRR